MMADIAVFDLNRSGMAGTGYDPLAALVFCNPGLVAYSIINGKVVVDKGQLTLIELDKTLMDHNALAATLYP